MVVVGCVVASAGACLIAGGAPFAVQTVHERIATGRVDWANFGVNVGLTVAWVVWRGPRVGGVVRSLDLCPWYFVALVGYLLIVGWLGVSPVDLIFTGSRLCWLVWQGSLCHTSQASLHSGRLSLGRSA